MSKLLLTTGGNPNLAMLAACLAHPYSIVTIAPVEECPPVDMPEPPDIQKIIRQLSDYSRPPIPMECFERTRPAYRDRPFNGFRKGTKNRR